MTKNTKVKITRNEEEEPVAIEILEKSIVEIAKGMKKFADSRVRPEHIVTLITRASGVNRGDVERVIAHLENIESLLLKPKKK
jgi:2-phosphoglycerate kinase